MSENQTRVLPLTRTPMLEQSATRKLIARWMPTGRDLESRNLRNVIMDGIGVGFASAAAPFLPVFLARLGASDLAVGLLSAMPAFAGFLFALPVGQFLARQRQIVPWFSVARLLVFSSYTLTGLLPFFIGEHRVEGTILIWGLATLPQTFVNIAFTIVMAGVSGPQGRLSVMSRRWSAMAVITAITVATVGFLLDRIPFPLGYQLVFIVLSLGGVVSFYYSSQVVLPDQNVEMQRATLPLRQRTRDWLRTVRGQRRFVRFAVSQFVFRTGLTLTVPLIPLFYVRSLKADDASIGLINMVGSAVLIGAYFVWSRVSRRRGVRFGLLVTTLAMSLYPIVLSMSSQIGFVILLAGLAGVFGAGIDLLFFDALVSSFPPDASAMYVGLYQMTVYVATFAGPIIGTALSSYFGIAGGLVAAGIVQAAGFLLFVWLK